MLNVRVVFADFDDGVRIGTRIFVEDECVTHDVRFASLRAFRNIHPPAITGASAIFADGLRGNLRGGIRCAVVYLGTGILVLSFACESDRENIAARARLHHIDARVFHGEFTAKVAIHPLHLRVFVSDSALRDEVIDVVRPVLDGGIAHPRTLHADNLDDCAVQGFTAISRRGAAFNVMHLRTFVGDDEGAFKLPHVLAVDAEVCLQRVINFHTRWHIDETAAAPRRTIQCRELVIRRGDDGAEILLHQFWVFLDGGVGIKENHPDFVQFLDNAVVNDFGVVLCAYAGEELPFCLRNAEPIERPLDVLRHVVPTSLAPVGGFDVVVDVVKVELRQIAAPLRHRLLLENLVCVEPILAHPVGFFLDVAHLIDDFLVQTFPGFERGFDIIVEAVLILGADTEFINGLGLRCCHFLFSFLRCLPSVGAV